VDGACRQTSASDKRHERNAMPQLSTTVPDSGMSGTLCRPCQRHDRAVHREVVTGVRVPGDVVPLGRVSLGVLLVM
jgi:hypothetical protein